MTDLIDREKLLPQEREAFDNADHFTGVRGRGANRIRIERKTLAEIKEWADEFGDGKTMAYAVTKFGRFAHLTNF